MRTVSEVNILVYCGLGKVPCDLVLRNVKRTLNGKQDAASRREMGGELSVAGSSGNNYNVIV